MITKVSLFSIAAVLCFAAVVLAGSDSVSIAVSCTVPAAPAENMSLTEETPANNSVSGSGQELADDAGGKSVVRTLYPR